MRVRGDRTGCFALQGTRFRSQFVSVVSTHVSFSSYIHSLRRVFGFPICLRASGWIPILTSVGSAVLCAALLAGSGVAQVPDSAAVLYSSPHPAKEAAFGSAIALTGDRSGDGRSDVLVGAPNASVDGQSNAGRAYLLSGTDGRVLHRLVAPSPTVNARFGASVAGVGDVNGDGTNDLVVGAIGPERRGQAFVFNGSDGRLLHMIGSPAPEEGGLFARVIADFGDVDGDGAADVLFGAIGDGEDRAYLFSGETGRPIWTASSPTEGHDHFGRVEPVGDVTGDGQPDVVIGASTTTVGDRAEAGRAYVYDGSTGTHVRTFSPPASDEGHYGYVLSSVGDANEDGTPDIAIGAVRGREDGTRIYVYGGASGDVIHTLTPPNPSRDGYFGYSMAGIGPSISNGRSLLVLGTRVPASDTLRSGATYLFDPRSGQRIHTWTSELTGSANAFGASVDVAPGGTEDSTAVVVVGAPSAPVDGVEGAGRVYRFSVE